MSNRLNSSTVLAILLAFDPGELFRHNDLFNGRECNIHIRNEIIIKPRIHILY